MNEVKKNEDEQKKWEEASKAWQNFNNDQRAFFLILLGCALWFGIAKGEKKDEEKSKES